MTSEEKVKQVYPGAWLSGVSTLFGFSWCCYSGPRPYYGIELAVVHQRRRSWAWAEAWRFIKSQPDGGNAKPREPKL